MWGLDEISIWQASLLTSFAIAALIGRPRLVLVFVMFANLLFSIILGPHYTLVMIFDLVCAAALMGRGVRADFVALLFAMMVPIYGLAIVFGWKVGTTYAIIEILSYLQIAIIGGVGRGYINRIFGPDYRDDGSLRPVGERGNHFYTSSQAIRDQEIDKKGRDLD